MATRAARGFGQYDGVARAIERVGERWALLIVRDLLVGPRRYGDLSRGCRASRRTSWPTGSRSCRRPASSAACRPCAAATSSPPRPRARARRDRARAVGMVRARRARRGRGRDARRAHHRAARRVPSGCRGGMPPTEYVLHVGDASVAAVVVGGTLDVVPIGPDALPQPRRPTPEAAFEANLEVAADPAAFRDLLAGRVEPGSVAILAGEGDASCGSRRRSASTRSDRRAGREPSPRPPTPRARRRRGIRRLSDRRLRRSGGVRRLRRTRRRTRSSRSSELLRPERAARVGEGNPWHGTPGHGRTASWPNRRWCWARCCATSMRPRPASGSRRAPTVSDGRALAVVAGPQLRRARPPLRPRRGRRARARHVIAVRGRDRRGCVWPDDPAPTSLPRLGDRHPRARTTAADGLRIVPHQCPPRRARQPHARRRLVARLRPRDGRRARGAPRSAAVPRRSGVRRLTTKEMQEFIRSRRDIREEPGKELKDYEEYAHLYQLAWSDEANRWLLSTVPTAMIFDDHDIRDDWNASLDWKREMEATSWWHERIVAGLASYWVYQHLGNLSPRERAEDELWQRIVAHDGELRADLSAELDEFADRCDSDPNSYRWSCSGLRRNVRSSWSIRVASDLTPTARGLLDRRRAGVVRRPDARRIPPRAHRHLAAVPPADGSAPRRGVG